jgi:hypothetical protein
VRVPPGAHAGHKEEDPMLYELRTCYCMPGRLPDVVKRFENITLKLFDKHGIRQVGFWTTVIGSNSHVLYYMLEWNTLAEREQKWNVFATDPEWLVKRAESERNGPLVERFSNEILNPTAFSKLK